jgi:hypothetical protein
MSLGGYGLLHVFPVLFKFGLRFVVVWVALSLVGGVDEFRLIHDDGRPHSVCQHQTL